MTGTKAKYLKIALIQFQGVLGEVEHNLSHALNLIEKAAVEGAEIVCLPELFATGYNLSLLQGDSIRLSNHYYDLIVNKISAVAKSKALHIIAPIGRKTDLPGILRNSALLFDDTGQLFGYFDKTHLWALERLYYQEGDSYPIFDLNIKGKHLRLGMMICYDAGFPEACRSLALNGAEIVFCPAAWRIQDVDMWDLNLAQRALENLLFVVGVNRVGHEGDLHLFGKSKICNPRGTVVKELPMDEETVEVYEIDLDDVLRFRTEIPYLRDRKSHIYTLD